MVTSDPNAEAADKSKSGDAKTEVLKQTSKGAKIQYANDIVFEDIPIYSPNGDELISKMSFKI